MRYLYATMLHCHGRIVASCPDPVLAVFMHDHAWLVLVLFCTDKWADTLVKF
jgi:hypothetical protein